MRVSLFVPCLVDQFYPDVAENTIRVLRRAGVEVDYSKEQTCCGQPFFKAGYWQKTLGAARRTIMSLKEADMVVAPSGSCVAMMRKGYLELFRDDPQWLEPAQDLSEKVFELSEFLVNVVKVVDLGASYPAKAVYHSSCQLSRALGIHEEPRRLLQQIRDLELIEMERPDLCCGFGGIFSFKFPHIAEAMVEEKVRTILASGADTVIGGEISCLMNIGGYLDHKGIPIKTLYLADILASTTKT